MRLYPNWKQSETKQNKKLYLAAHPISNNEPGQDYIDNLKSGINLLPPTRMTLLSHCVKLVISLVSTFVPSEKKKKKLPFNLEKCGATHIWSQNLNISSALPHHHILLPPSCMSAPDTVASDEILISCGRNLR